MGDFVKTIPDSVQKPSAYNNRGLFSTIDRAQGDLLCVLGGEVVRHQNDFDLLSTMEWNAIDDDRILLRQVPTSYFLINHSRRPNLTIDPKTHELRAKAAIAKDEEMLLDYLENGFPQEYLRTDHCGYLR